MSSGSQASSSSGFRGSSSRPISSSGGSTATVRYREGDRPIPGYTLVRELGGGTFGVVWLARTDSGIEQALKIVNLARQGSRKEYRGLRTIKQKKIKQGNLLTLIDYWLLDANGQFVSDTEDLGDIGSPSLRGRDTDRGDLSATVPQRGSTTADDGPRMSPEAASAATVAQEISVSGTRAEAPRGAELPRGTLAGSGAQAQAASSSAVAAAPPSGFGRPVLLIMAMELGDTTLDKLLKENHSGLPIGELLEYMEQAARGLDFLHSKGIVHRDIKPANIMIVGDVAKVCDYGLIVTVDDDLKATSNAFTPLYVSPEALRELPLTGRSDQYSLAVSYIELRTGHTPYAEETTAVVYAAKESGKHDLSRLHKNAVRTVLKRALAKNPDDRFPTCAEFVRQLGLAEHARSPWPKRLMTAVALVAMLALGGLGVWNLMASRPAVVQASELEQLTAEIKTQTSALNNSATLDEANKKLGEGDLRLDELDRRLDALGQLHPELKAKLQAQKAAVWLLRARLAVGNSQWTRARQQGAPDEKLLSDDDKRLLPYLDIMAFAHDQRETSGNWDDVEARASQLKRDTLKPLLSVWEIDLYPPKDASGFDKMLTNARKDRLKGDFAPARTRLDIAKSDYLDGRTNKGPDLLRYRLEKLHLDLASATGDWQKLRREAEDLTSERPSEVQDQDRGELAAVRLLAETELGQRQAAPDVLSILPLMRDVNWKQLDDKRLSEEEINALLAVRDKVGVLLSGVKTLPSATELGGIWPSSDDRAKLKESLDQRILAHKEESDAVLDGVQKDFQALYKALELDDPAQLFVRMKKERGDLALQIERKELRKYIENDNELLDPARCQEILTRIKGQGDGIDNDQALTLLRAELELETSGALTLKSRNILNRIAENTSGGDLVDYARFLRARPSSDAKPGDVWPDSASAANSSWRTERRKKQAFQRLARLAGEALPINSLEDIVGFSELTVEQAKPARELVKKAMSLDPSSTEIHAVDAVLRVIERGPQANQEDWTSIRQLGKDLREIAPSNDPKTQLRQQTLNYVVALAAAKTEASANLATKKEAVQTFADLLRDSRIFREHERADVTRDGNLLKNIVAPGLAVAKLDSPSVDDKQNLAVLWAAKGRILERNEDLVDILEPAGKDDPIDSYSRAVLKANKAFGKARELADAPGYASGYGRTLLELPHEFKAIQHLPELASLIDKYDREGTSDDQGLLLVGGWVKFQQVEFEPSWPRKSELVNEALRRFAALETAAGQGDPYNIRTLGHVNAGEVHVWASFLAAYTEKQDIREKQFVHLTKAVELADSAIKDALRRLPEDAHMVRGHALEDQAYKCRRLENYPKAVEAFQDAVKATEQLRSNVNALMSKGRCQFRWARDTAGNVRQQQLREAYVSLQAALEEAAQKPSMHTLETRWWLAHVMQEAARNGPGNLQAAGPAELAPLTLENLKKLWETKRGDRQLESEIGSRLRLWEEARQLFIDVAKKGAMESKSNWVTFQLDCAESAGIEANETKTIESFLPRGVQRADILDCAIRHANDLLTDGEGLLTAPQARRSVGVLFTGLAERDGQQPALNALNQWRTKLFNKPDDAWRWELVTLTLMQGANQAAIAEAKRVAEQITDPSWQSLATGNCLTKAADLEVKSLRANPTKAELASVRQKYRDAERAYLASADPTLAKNHAELKSTRITLSEVLRKDLSRKINRQEAVRLRDALTPVAETYSSAVRFLYPRLADVDAALLQPTKPFEGETKEIAQMFYEVCKCQLFITQESISPNLKTKLETIERKLSL